METQRASDHFLSESRGREPEIALSAVLPTNPAAKTSIGALSAEQLLGLWLDAQDSALSQNLLAELIVTHADPILRKVIGFKLRTFRGDTQTQVKEEIEDVRSEALLSLLQYLDRLKHQAAQKPIENFKNYVAVIAHNACAEYLRKKYPSRQRYKDKLRYILTRQAGLALWEDSRGVWLCGFRVWQNSNKAAFSLAQILVWRQESSHLQAWSEWSQGNLVELLTSIFNHFGGPIEFDAVINLVSDPFIKKDQPVSIESPLCEIRLESAYLARHEPTGKIEQRLYLQQLWIEICKLPLSNRTALLLNLRDADEKGLIALLADLQIVSLPAIAEALAMSTTQFAQIWNSLPLDDAQIANLMGSTRQQVINLRKAARRWLSKQLNIHRK